MTTIVNFVDDATNMVIQSVRSSVVPSEGARGQLRGGAVMLDREHPTARFPDKLERLMAVAPRN